MVPLSLKYVWQWLRLTTFWLLPDSIQERKKRTEILDHVKARFDNLCRELNVNGTIIGLERRFLRLEMEGLIICVDVDSVLSHEDPHLSCLIVTGDPNIYHLARSMFLQIAASLEVRMFLTDLEHFWKVEHYCTPVKLQIANAIISGANLWSCLGCDSLQVYESIHKGYIGECLYHKEARLPLEPDGAYIQITTKCGHIYLRLINSVDLENIGII
jgi:hypothetical protein